jgi:hypothetical protein
MAPAFQNAVKTPSRLQNAMETALQKATALSPRTRNRLGF